MVTSSPAGVAASGLWGEPALQSDRQFSVELIAFQVQSRGHQRHGAKPAICAAPALFSQGVQGAARMLQSCRHDPRKPMPGSVAGAKPRDASGPTTWPRPVIAGVQVQSSSARAPQGMTRRRLPLRYFRSFLLEPHL